MQCDNLLYVTTSLKILLFLERYSFATIVCFLVAEHLSKVHLLVGLVVKVSTSGVEDTGFESRLRWDFSGWVIPMT